MYIRAVSRCGLVLTGWDRALVSVDLAADADPLRYSRKNSGVDWRPGRQLSGAVSERDLPEDAQESRGDGGCRC